MEILSALVERVTYHDPETGFCVLRTLIDGKRAATIVGHLAAVTAGESIEATGEWKNDKVHGRQFEASAIQTSAPTTRRGIEKYLAGGAVKGIGPSLARQLVQEFGTGLFDIIEKSPARLRRVAGIGPKRVKMIRESWGEQRSVRDLMVFLHSHGVGTARAVRIQKRYGGDAIRLIRENPYRLADDIRGIGFLSADKIALDLGFDRASMHRVRAGVGHALSEAVAAGHCALPREALLASAEKLLEVARETVEQALEMEISAGHVIADSVGEVAAIFPGRLYRAEIRVARDIRRLRDGPLPWPSIDVEKALRWAERRLEIDLAPSQREAVRLALRSKTMVITGGPGVGKTTLVNTIITILGAKDISVALCAPTGRAAKRLTESTGCEAKTIHRLLEVDAKKGAFRRNRDNPLECDLLVVDETSMVDILLMEALMRAVGPEAAVLFVGDADQLPSVGPGNVLGDVIASGSVPVVHLTEVFRQAARSRIIVNAHRINGGQMPELTPSGGEALSDFYFVKADAAGAAEKIVQIVRERIPARFGLDPVRDVQVLSPMNRGAVGVKALNAELRAALNPAPQGEIERYGSVYAARDKVMQIENNYEKEVFNGDSGVVLSIDAEKEEMVIDFDGRQVSYSFGELDQITLAYATTIHKSQGSEYPAVVIPVSTQHYVMLQKNLLYTAVTRGKRLVVMVGEKRAIEIAVHNQTARQRWSKLREWLQAERLPETPTENLFV